MHLVLIVVVEIESDIVFFFNEFDLIPSLLSLKFQTVNRYQISQPLINVDAESLPVVSSSHEPTTAAGCGKYSLVEREGGGQLISPNYRVALARSSSLKVCSSSSHL
jgi:hypothetical protein